MGVKIKVSAIDLLTSIKISSINYTLSIFGNQLLDHQVYHYLNYLLCEKISVKIKKNIKQKMRYKK